MFVGFLARSLDRMISVLIIISLERGNETTRKKHFPVYVPGIEIEFDNFSPLLELQTEYPSSFSAIFSSSPDEFRREVKCAELKSLFGQLGLFADEVSVTKK